MTLPTIYCNRAFSKTHMASMTFCCASGATTRNVMEPYQMHQHDFQQAVDLGVVSTAEITRSGDNWRLCIHIRDQSEPKVLRTKDGEPRNFRSTDAAVNSCAAAGLTRCSVLIKND